MGSKKFIKQFSGESKRRAGSQCGDEISSLAPVIDQLINEVGLSKDGLGGLVSLHR
jgi:hypothetical protein